MLRSVAYFGGHSSAVAATVLTAYAVGGLILVAAGRRGLSASPQTSAPAVAGARETVLAG